MEVKKSYWRRGTPDLPVATYIGIANQNMIKWSKNAEFHRETEITPLYCQPCCHCEPVRRLVWQSKKAS